MAQRMRVLHIQRAKGLSGSERHLLALLPALREQDIDAHMCVLSAPGGEAFVDALRARAVPTVTVDAHGDVSARVARDLARLITRVRPDVVHTHLVHADVHGQPVARLRRVPGVSSFHDTERFHTREPVLTTERLVGRLVGRRIAISQHVARFLRTARIARDDQIRVVPYGITVDGAQDELANEVRLELGIAPDAFVLAIASRLIPGKGHEVLLDACALASEQVEGLRLLIAGDGPERARLEAYAAQRGVTGRVTFLGYRDDVQSVIRACDALVFPTQPELGEGFGLSALEAMAMGRPVIASRLASLPEIIEDDVTGILVPPSSPAAWADAIVHLSRDPARCRRMGRAAAARARTVFPIEAMVARTVAVYEELL